VAASKSFTKIAERLIDFGEAFAGGARKRFILVKLLLSPPEAGKEKRFCE
jgi:hypothetical protein